MPSFRELANRGKIDCGWSFVRLAFWVTLPVIVLDMMLITCEAPRLAVWEVQLHDAQYRCMSQGMTLLQPRKYLQELCVENIQLRLKPE
jgi:hypothetical protein